MDRPRPELVAPGPATGLRVEDVAFDSGPQRTDARWPRRQIVVDHQLEAGPAQRLAVWLPI